MIARIRRTAFILWLYRSNPLQEALSAALYCWRYS